MKNVPFEQFSQEEQDWIDGYLDGTIDPHDFEELQRRMLGNPQLRAALRRYLCIDDALRNDGCAEPVIGANPWLRLETADVPSRSTSPSRFVPTAVAAALAFLLGMGLMSLNTGSRDRTELSESESDSAQHFAEGFAVVEHLFDVAWPQSATSFQEGQALGAESFQIASGIAEISFYSGATMTVAGPATIAVTSAWEADCLEGAVRMKVPPAARGFKLHTPSTEIVDLGTEFGLSVHDGKGHVEVFDGEIAIRHLDEAERLVTTGTALDLTPDGAATQTQSGSVRFPDVAQLGERARQQQRSSFKRWQAHRDRLAKDDRLIAYYTFDRDGSGALVSNLTVPRNPHLDGTVVLAEPVGGRWPDMKAALEFRRPGSRVRVNVPGEFSAFTFAAWVRIDSLDRWYNALFMGDGYETGEPHWQIRDDGKLMLSVMIDDSKPHPTSPNSRYHKVYFSPSIWDLSMSGQWMHLASVFDPKNRIVSHYVNGERVSREEIAPDFVIESLRIGNGEIGNWGQPFREDPTFAIRNLNGRMDEIAIFGAALSDQEIADLCRDSGQSD